MQDKSNPCDSKRIGCLHPSIKPAGRYKLNGVNMANLLGDVWCLDWNDAQLSDMFGANKRLKPEDICTTMPKKESILEWVKTLVNN